MTADKKPNPKHDEILSLIKERFKLCEDAEADSRKLALEDLEFAAGDQWPVEVLRKRKAKNKPCLTVNRIPQFIRQITNDIRQNKPAIKVSPVDDQADIDTAKIYQGIIRHIEYSSNADTAYDRASDSAVRCGFGFIRLVTEYCDHASFNLDIRIKSVRNRFKCFIDPFSKEPDGSDAEYGFEFDDMKPEAYKAQFPNSKLSHKNADWDTFGAQAPGWMAKERVRVAEYFAKEYQDDTIIQLSDGSTVLESELEQKIAEGLNAGIVLDEQGQPVVRKTKVPVVKWYKTNGVEILEETIWPSKWIPIIPVLGEEHDINGKRILEGVVRHAKDPQRIVNYQTSNEAEAIALAPKAPYIGTIQQFKGLEKIWENANDDTFAFLPYNPDGQAPPPQRNFGEPAVQAITNAKVMAAEDLKAVTGIYDAALGNRSNENSGVAIQRRAMQAQTSNFHFVDNLSKSIRHVGRCLVDLIPKVYDAERAIRILGEDGNEEVIKINQEFEHKGELKTYSFSKGKYDVTVSSGPSYETKRQESLATMLELTKSVPQIGQVAPDLLIKAMDFPMAQELAERLKKTLPPGMADDPNGKKPLPPEAQAQMQQQMQMIEQLTEQLKAKTELVATKQMEHDSAERIAAMNNETKAAIELAKLESKEATEFLYAQIQELDARFKQSALYTQNQDQQQPPMTPDQSMGEVTQPNPSGGASSPEFLE